MLRCTIGQLDEDGVGIESGKPLKRVPERLWRREVPRETSLQACAQEMGLSHQALSERLRRGTEALVEDTLLFEAPDEESEGATANTQDGKRGQVA